jgi:hypothetical protein
VKARIGGPLRPISLTDRSLHGVPPLGGVGRLPGVVDVLAMVLRWGLGALHSGSPHLRATAGFGAGVSGCRFGSLPSGDPRRRSVSCCAADNCSRSSRMSKNLGI